MMHKTPIFFRSDRRRRHSIQIGSRRSITSVAALMTEEVRNSMLPSMQLPDTLGSQYRDMGRHTYKGDIAELKLLPQPRNMTV